MHPVLMHALIVAAATPSPKPTTPPADEVTPGVWGFVIVFAIAVVTILLIWDMMRRVRRTRYRSEVNARLDAEEAQRSDSSAVAKRDADGGTGRRGEASGTDRSPHDDR
jgi:flagellar biosynthesis/type III secretory pathway M-ring protein FliF/YscJ